MTGYRDPHAVAELAGKILIVSIIVLSVIVTFLSFFHFYSKWTRNRREQLQLQLQLQSQSQLQAPATHRHRRHQEPSSGVTVLRRGLNPSFLKTIPITPFNPKNFNQGFEFECAVCLSEVCEGEKTRFLPKCNHGFHVECIDMWFYSHSTCPICRSHVSVENEISVENLLEIPQSQEESNVDLQYFPTNVLFWGNETEVSTLTSQFEEANSELTSSSSASSSASSSTSLQTGLVIDIPGENEIDIDIEDQKSPVSSRMRSFRRILSGSRRFMNPFSPASVNLEQGTRGQL